jgi:hypothetical protein
LNKKVLFAFPALIGILVAGAGFITFFDHDRFFDLQERILFDNKFIHDHSLDSPKAVAFHRVIESDKLSFKDRIVLDSIGKHDLSTAKTILFSKILDADEVALKKKLIFNSLHEFDHHNFHDFCHKSHNASSIVIQDFCP